MTADFELPKGFKVGNANDDCTGVTVILPDGECVCGVDVRGGAPGTRETDLLKNEKTVSVVNAVALCGGSAFGLEAACGVMEYLLKKKTGFKAMDKIVPIVPAAVIFDLKEGYRYPDKNMGIDACVNASEKPLTGRVGAGKGATVGKIRGAKNACQGGLGIATVKAFGINVTALLIVNAFGDVYDYRTNTIAAGAKTGDGFANTYQSMLSGSVIKLLTGVKDNGKDKDKDNKDNKDAKSNIEGANTTIGCILTDARLTKVEANKLASIAHNGLVLSIRPVHTDYDGDTLFCMSTDKKKVLNFACLQTMAVEAVALAALNAVKQ